MNFWNKDCKELSDKLWKPNINEQNYEKSNIKIANCYNCTIYRDTNGKNTTLRYKKFDIDNKMAINKHNNLLKKLRQHSKIKILRTKIMLRNLMFRYTKNKSKNCKKKIMSRKLNIVAITEQHCKEINRINNRMTEISSYGKNRLYLTQRQEKIIRLWLSENDKIYNELVNEFMIIYDDYRDHYHDNNEFVDNIKKNNKFPLDFTTFKNNYLCNRHYIVPYDIVEATVSRILMNINVNLDAMAKYQIDNFSLKQKKNRIVNSITISNKSIDEFGFHVDILGKISTNFNWKTITTNIHVVYDRNMKIYYVNIPNVENKIINKRNPIIIMDPGLKTFQSGYGINHYIEIGKDSKKFIKNKLRQIERIQKKINQLEQDPEKGDKKKLTKKINRINNNINNMINNMHDEIINYLCKNYDRIITTTFTCRKNKNMKNILNILSHEKFKQKLKKKCIEYSCLYLEVDESFTTKICCKCGYYNKVNKKYDCDKCNNIMLRDMNGAINIFLKNHKMVLY